MAQDVVRLSQKFEKACLNHQKAALHLQQLRQLRGEPRPVQELWELDDLMRIHEGKRRVYQRASQGIYAILGLNRLMQLMLAEMAEQIHHALHSSLDILRDLAAGRELNRYTQREFAQACGRLRSYRTLYDQQGGPRPGLE